MEQKEIDKILKAIENASQQPLNRIDYTSGLKITYTDGRFQNLLGGLSTILNIDLAKYCNQEDNTIIEKL